MFDTERFIAECRSALHETSPQEAIREIVQRTVPDNAGLIRALGTPRRSEIVTLHQSPELTILNIIWGPGMTIYPHDHRMWAVIGVYEGREDNAFFKRTANGLVRASARQLEAGEVARLGAETVHAVTNSLGRFTGALQIYGGDFFNVSRSEFDPDTLEERPFDVEKAKAVFLAANARLPS
jgi:predicted metal-dependent enzyme (double-stranded beta helix superfamily)